ncbi:MarR family winged helix-turn-helix transcriptional regulator [Bradyrhizobium archetypum]|uniref:MarR family transcriptional regulator n=1 Tax=Bradyrhizobium archetypum TaxID=2721160 RepID=A0A7Y4H6A8_9BRAD|nr:helix-turn-helix domain-containing protein [Bradyrhizobium archetypum]NOJ48431.1 MarR family transcriptional regulator [Bradyrhizobium archetypum]
MTHARRPTAALPRAVDFLSACRELAPYVPAQTVTCLLVIASRPGITMQELAEETGLSQSSCSRNVAVLSRWETYGKPGLGLVEAFEEPRERRRKIVYLTADGQQKVQSIVGKLDPSFKLKPQTRLGGLVGLQ